jgi:hypothetical protein
LRRFGPGSWVGLYKEENFAGSFGLPVKDRTSGEVMMLTAAHVIGGLFPWPNDQTAVVGYGNLLPHEPHDTITTPLSAVNPDLGRVERSVPPRREQKCSIDAAIARVSSNRELVNSFNGAPVTGVRDIRDILDTDIAVEMFGARSNGRRGILNTAPVMERLRLGGSEHRVLYERACLVRSLDDRPFAEEGDSGSVLVDEDLQAIAMIVGMIRDDSEPTACAVATPIAPALDALGVEIYAGETSVCTQPVQAVDAPG